MECISFSTFSVPILKSFLWDEKVLYGYGFWGLLNLLIVEKKSFSVYMLRVKCAK
jgi:hypothetical protein